MTDLDELSKKIEKAKKTREASPENLKGGDPETKKDMSFGMRVGVELFAGITVGLVIGYFLDKAFHTMPLFLLIFTIIGAAAGFWNIYKSFYKDQE